MQNLFSPCQWRETTSTESLPRDNQNPVSPKKFCTTSATTELGKVSWRNERPPKIRRTLTFTWIFKNMTSKSDRNRNSAQARCMGWQGTNAKDVLTWGCISSSSGGLPQNASPQFREDVSNTEVHAITSKGKLTREKVSLDSLLQHCSQTLLGNERSTQWLSDRSFPWASARHVRANMLVFPGFGGLTEVFGCPQVRPASNFLFGLIFCFWILVLKKASSRDT